MNILYIITQADGGGAQKYVLTLARHFKGTIAAGNEATQLFTDAANLRLKTYNLQHLKRNISPANDLLAIFEIRSLIKKINPDIVHLNSSKAGFLGSLACIGLKTKVVFTAHGFIFNEPMPGWKKTFYISLEKLASAFRDFTITVSNADKKSALDNNLTQENKVQTIHNGIPKLTFLESLQARSHLNLPEEYFIFGTIANFYTTKGIDVLIEAISLLNTNTLTKCKFVIIGNGPELKNLELGIKNLELEKAVIFIQKNQAWQYLQAFNAFVLPSRKEGFPYTLLEAMQAGLPIAATRVGGIPEALGDAGILVEPGNAKALAKAIDSLSNKQKQEELSKKARERSFKFSEERMLKETEEIYKKLAA
ncbi:MAG: glycosyltransferase family 4 protein [Candidatus Doudnabacteria bacterium]|nr:glycosyltransferase family 4 protein [Candidatus Doudnabacteria bacterium]